MTPQLLTQVPWDAVMPRGPQLLLTAVSAGVFILALWFMFGESRRRGDWVPWYAFIGAGLIVVYEPLGDMLVSALYPLHEQIAWIDLFGRKIPLFIGLLYFWYMSVPAIYFMKKVDQGLTRASLWKMYVLSSALAIGIELIGVNLGAWVYYGPHPYVLLGVPLWCTATYSGFMMTTAIGLRATVQHLQRRDHWLVVFAVPLFMAGGHCVMALPAAAAMFSTDEPLWIWLGATASIGLSLLITHVAGLLYCVDSPYKRSGGASAVAGRGAQAARSY